MPELPEVETVARQLHAVLPGKTIATLEVLREKSFRGDENQVIGRSISRVSRKAKMIVVSFHASSYTLLVHLKMTGQLIFQPKEVVRANTPGVFHLSGTFTPGVNGRIVGGHPTPDWVNDLPSKHTRVTLSFTDGSKLFFNDMRVFGWIKTVRSTEYEVLSSQLPPDVVDPEFTVEYLTTVLRRSGRPVKLVLLDQANIGGLGNIYVNDALYLAGTNPTRKANSLTRDEINHLHEACVKVINRGIEVGGASESTYKHINGLGGKYQEEFLLYKRAGEVCNKNGCKALIEKIKLGGRGTYFCPSCQI